MNNVPLFLIASMAICVLLAAWGVLYFKVSERAFHRGLYRIETIVRRAGFLLVSAAVLFSAAVSVFSLALADIGTSRDAYLLSASLACIAGVCCASAIKMTHRYRRYILRDIKRFR